MAIIDKIQLSGTVYTIGNETTTAVTSASTDNEIPTAKAVYDAIPQGGGGKAVSGGTNISITTGETADTINCTLPISADTNTISINKTNIKIGTNNVTTSNLNRVQIAIGDNVTADGIHSFAFGIFAKASNYNTVSMGYGTESNNQYQASFGKYNVTSSASTTFGDSGNTLFSVGNGTANYARHNAFEVRQNGDIYITKNGQDVKLQDQLGGGGSDINVVQTTGTSTTDVMSQNAVTTQLSGYVTTDTLQDITVQKTFVGDPSNRKKSIKFKQYDNASKVGFVIVNSAETNNEVASFEFRPNTFTIDNVQHPLLYFGHYRNTSTANAGVPQTVIGFRQYDQKNTAAYHYLLPLPEKAKTPFSLTTSFKDYYAPLGFKVDSGGTMVTTDNTGVVDLSSYLGGGGSITIDPTLNTGSTNAVANSAISAALNYNNMFLYRVEPKRTWNNHPTGTLQLRWRNPYNGSTSTTQDAITLVKINNIPLIADSVSGIYNLNLVETSAITTSISSSSTDAQVPSAKAVNDKLGGLSLVKLTQAEYDALATKDSNVLYVIVG